MRAILAASTLILVAVAVPASAQTAYRLALAPGSQVRIETNQQPGRKITGELYGTMRDTLHILNNGTVGAYAVADLRGLEIRNGEDKKLGMLIGAGIGAAVGFLENTEERFSVTVGTALIGTLVGYVFAPKGWERIPVPARQ